MDTPDDRPRLCRTDAFVLFVLFLAGLKYTYGINHVMDVTLYDESGYLHSGAALRRIGLPAPEYAPLYALWYYALSLVQPDLVSLYYLNYALTTILPPLFLYALLRVNRVPIVAGALAAAYFLITQANYVTWPRPSHFALLIILAFLALAVRARRASTGVLLLAGGALLAAYARPEYFLAFLLLLALGTARLVAGQRRGTVPPRAWLPLGAVALAAALLLGVFGLPAFGKGGGERHYYAFSQHFVFNWTNWTHADPNGSNAHFREITARYFGHAQTVSGAVRHNPAVFAHHVFTNVRNGLSRFPGLFLHHENILLPPGTWFENLEARLTLLGLAGFIFARRQAWWPALGTNLRQNRRLLLCSVVLCVPGAISIVEIFPRDHYMLLPGTLLIVALAVLLRGRGEAGTCADLPWRQTALLALGILAVGPALSRGPKADTSTAQTIRYLQALGVKEPVRLLEAEGGYDFYQGDNYSRVANYDKNAPFDQFLKTAGINMIVLTERLNQDRTYADDPAWHDFLNHYQEAGFESRPVPGSGTTLLIRRQLLPPAG